MLTMHGCRFVTGVDAPDEAQGKHTYLDWGMLPTEKLAVQTPPDETPTVKIPYAVETPEVRITSVSGGKPVYGMRSGAWEFKVMTRSRWAAVLSDLANYLHGQEVLALLDDDDSYFYRGVMTVDKLSSNRSLSTVSLKYKFRPYKYDRFSGIEDWMWDPFDFETGVVREYKDLPVNASAAEPMLFTVTGSRMPVTPGFYCTGTVALTYGGYTNTLTPTADPAHPVRNVLPIAVIGTEDAVLSFAGSGTVSIDFRGGSL